MIFLRVYSTPIPADGNSISIPADGEIRLTTYSSEFIPSGLL